MGVRPERCVVAHAGQVLVARRPLAGVGVVAERDAQVLDRLLAVAGERVVAGELVVQRGVLGPVVQARRGELDRALVAAGADGDPLDLVQVLQLVAHGANLRAAPLEEVCVQKYTVTRHNCTRTSTGGWLRSPRGRLEGSRGRNCSPAASGAMQSRPGWH